MTKHSNTCAYGSHSYSVTTIMSHEAPQLLAGVPQSILGTTHLDLRPSVYPIHNSMSGVEATVFTMSQTKDWHLALLFCDCRGEHVSVSPSSPLLGVCISPVLRVAYNSSPILCVCGWVSCCFVEVLCMLRLYVS